MALCLLGNGFFAGIETGIVSVNRLRLEHFMRKGFTRANIVNDFLSRPDHLLGTTLIGTNLCMVATSVVSASLSRRLMGEAGSSIATVVTTLAILIFGEYLPKAWFRGRPAIRSMRFIQILRVFGYIFHPVSVVVTGVTRLLIPSPSRIMEDVAPFITKDELKHLTVESEKTGALSSDERKMIHGVFELTRKPCRDIMVPLPEVIRVRDDQTADELLEIARTRGLSRIAVYKEEARRFVGVANIRDVVADPNRAGRLVHVYMRPPQFVSENTPLDEVLPRMRRSRQPMVLVTDKNSEVIGLVTIEDVLEEIVGQF